MAQIYDRLIGLKYQVIKGETLTDEQKVHAVRSIFDAAINETTTFPEGAILPIDILGVTAQWSEDNKTLRLLKDSILIEDNLADNTIPSVDEFANYLMVNDDFLFVNNDYLLVA